MPRSLDKSAPAVKPSLPAGVPDPAALLAWYDRHARVLPWRVGPADRHVGERPDPYRVWLSEVMLQQTTVKAVIPYFLKMTARWPTVAELAAAPDGDVMAAWAGLGYYSRARNLIACARAVADRPGGRFPATEAGLRGLPGIGAYTAAAIAAIAFDEPAAVVDGNVERVVTRFFAIDTPLPAAKAEVRQRLGPLVPADRPGEFAEAMMDLGATICTPKRPACALCPWNDACTAHAEGREAEFPRKAAKRDQPTRLGIAYVARRADGAILLRSRPPKGLLGGMTEVPGGPWAATREESEPPLPAHWRELGQPVEHVFTHFRLLLTVRVADVDQAEAAPPGCWWSTKLSREALPSLMNKVIEAAAPGATRPARMPAGSPVSAARA